LPPRAVEVTSSLRPEPTTRGKDVGSSSRSEARLVREDQRVTRSRTAPRGSGTLEGQRDLPRRDDPPRWPVEHEPSPHHLFDSSDRQDADSLQRRSLRARSTMPASTPSVPQGASTSIPSQSLQSLVIRGGGALDVHVPLSVSGSQGPASNAAEVGRTAPVQLGVRSTIPEPQGRSGQTP
jgi:hypothetical protein